MMSDDPRIVRSRVDISERTNFVDANPLRPRSIEHKCEQLFVADKLEQSYN